MSQLNQILGAILRDIAQARVTSDMYSRDVSKYYERDSLLRLFPIPRAEIKEVEINLNFSIKDVNEVKTDESVYEKCDISVVNGLFNGYSETIITEVIDKIKENDNVKWNEWEKEYGIEDLDKLFFNILKPKLVNYFENNIDTLIRWVILESKLKQKDPSTDAQTKDIVFNRDEAVDKVLAILRDNLYAKRGFEFIEDTTRRVTIKKKVGNVFNNESSRSHIRTILEKTIDSLFSELKKEFKVSERYKIDVGVTLDELKDLPPDQVCSVKITSELRNYVWSQVEEEKGGKSARRLVPE